MDKLFPDQIEYRMGPNCITDKRTLWWFTEYWKADGELLVTQCDPELGNTIRCDLEFTSDCTSALGWGPLHFDAKFTVWRGKIEKMIVTMPKQAFRELSKVLEGMFAWTAANMPSPWAEAVNSGDPRAASHIEMQACIEYGIRPGYSNALSRGRRTPPARRSRTTEQRTSIRHPADKGRPPRAST